MKKIFKIQAMLLCAALMAVSCADDRMIDDQEEGDKGVAVSFNVSTAQDKMLQQQQQAPATRAAASRAWPTRDSPSKTSPRTNMPCKAPPTSV